MNNKAYMSNKIVQIITQAWHMEQSALNIFNISWILFRNIHSVKALISAQESSQMSICLILSITLVNVLLPIMIMIIIKLINVGETESTDVALCTYLPVGEYAYTQNMAHRLKSTLWLRTSFTGLCARTATREKIHTHTHSTIRTE